MRLDLGRQNYLNEDNAALQYQRVRKAGSAIQ